MGDPSSSQVGLVDRRIRSILTAADLRQSGVDLAEMAQLMPPGGPGSYDSIHRWIQGNPSIATVHNGRVYLPERTAQEVTRGEEVERTKYYLEAARALVDDELRPLRPYLRSVLVTGSTAYGTPKPGDDCDLFAITRSGALWVVLLYSFLRLRMRGIQGRSAEGPEWCLNYVLDERAALEEFTAPRGFLFAREALSARPLWGAREYAALLAQSRWMASEAPGLYGSWETPDASLLRSRPAPWGIRLANAVVFPFLATYLQAVGLYRNWRLRQTGRGALEFVTSTRWGRLSIRSSKFDELGTVYRGSSAIGVEP